jgi:hypothetical protein
MHILIKHTNARLCTEIGNGAQLSFFTFFYFSFFYFSFFYFSFFTLVFFFTLVCILKTSEIMYILLYLVRSASYSFANLQTAQGCQIFIYLIYIPEWGKYTRLPLKYQVAIKYTKCPSYIPNGHRIFPNFFIPKLSII